MLTQSSLSRRLIETLASTLDPSAYIAGIGVEPFKWQHEALDPGCKRLILMCARQSGKSTVVAGKVTNKAKYIPSGLNIITSPTEKQSKETMLKVDESKADGIRSTLQRAGVWSFDHASRTYTGIKYTTKKEGQG